MIGNGVDTLFWTDPWLGGVPLRVLFGRLFELSNCQTSTVAVMYALGWEEGGVAWQWRRQHDQGGGYSVRSAYKLLTSMATPNIDALSNFLWHKQVPAKVSVLAWRLVRNRL
ncbi:cysteine-rich receptor-like protein kinase, partial [Trifolium medium]|nr:cysteine-rich receptor-like protein kinase [Trifolium medium]